MFNVYIKAQNMHVFMYFLHFVPPFTLHYIIMEKGLFIKVLQKLLNYFLSSSDNVPVHIIGHGAPHIKTSARY